MKAIPLKRGIKISILLLFVIVLSACNGSYKDENYSMEKVAVAEEYEAVADDSEMNFGTNKEAKTPKDLKIIKTANVRYKVNNVRLSTIKIKALANQFDAYLSDQRFENDLYRIENRFTIKVPKQNFDVLLDSINNDVEFIEFENITTKDVTEEYVDLETRLKTKLEVKARYEEVLRKNAKTVKEILATEEKLGIIQEEIEATQGRLKYLSNKVSYSTIQVDLYQAVEFKEEPVSYTKTFWSKVKDGLSFGWHLIESLILGLIHIWPLLILGTLITMFIRKKLRRK